MGLRPVCDLVCVTDRDWQPAIEAYLRTHVEALLVPPEHEERAVRLVRGLHGSRAVYGAKLALASHARRHADAHDDKKGRESRKPPPHPDHPPIETRARPGGEAGLG